MTVFELIRELSNFDPHQTVKISIASRGGPQHNANDIGQEPDQDDENEIAVVIRPKRLNGPSTR